MSQVRLATASTLQDKPYYGQGEQTDWFCVLKPWLPDRIEGEYDCIFTQLVSTDLMVGQGEPLLLKLNFVLKQPLLAPESREEKPVDLVLSSRDTLHLIHC